MTNITKIITEERGVAGCPYEDVFDEIFKELEEQCVYAYELGLLSKTRKFKPTVYDDLTERIDIVERLDMNVTVTDIEDEEYYMTGSGSFGIYYSSHLTDDNKISSVEIKIDTYSKNGHINKAGFMLNLFHEFNHLYDLYCEMVGNADKNRNSLDLNGRYAKDATKSEFDSKLSSCFNTEYNANMIRKILYRLYKNTEANAFAAMLYGELKGMNSERKNFRRDINNSMVYKTYLMLLFGYETAIDGIREENGMDFFIWMKEQGYKIRYYNSLEACKNSFKKATKAKLDKLKKKLYFVASNYYMHKETDGNRGSLTEMFSV